MKKDDLLVYAMAAGAAVLVAKAMGFSLSSLTGLKAQAQTFAQSIWNPINPAQGQSYNPADPGEFIWLNNLVNGTISDYYNNDQTSYNTPTINNIIDDVVGGDYSGAKQSIIRVDGAYW